MIAVKTEEGGSLNEEKCWLKVIVAGSKDVDKGEVLEEGKRIRWVLQKLEKALGFKVRNGLPVDVDNPYYFFMVQCLPKNKERTKETIKEIAEAGGETHYVH